EPPFRLFPSMREHPPEANRITIVLQPDEGIKLTFETKVPSIEGTLLQSRDLAFDYKGAFGALPESYERLLLDALQGDPSLFMRADEIERSWEVIDPFSRASEAAGTQPEEYPVGGDGPAGGAELLARDGRHWQPIR
ncbi:MAG TPA: glucose-6-phosphate dehydrogenase, partial [Gemmataceae bacterium]|nr:glucose-6-phosphate dehydrogenase [Gemmataceae bacterium]